MSSPFDALVHGAPPTWRRWEAATAAEAAARDLPLAVLVGDALDAWTASWLNALRADRELAGLLDQAFVPVAAERADHPGLAALAQQVLALSADASGVPCLLVLLPGGPPRPLGAVPYGPLRDSEGRKGLARVLLEVAEAWHADRAALADEAERLGGILAGLPFALAGDGRLRRERVLDLAEAQLMGEAHALEGGFGAAPDGSAALPRWPQPEKLRLLAALAARPGAAPSLAAHLERSLAALAAGGIRDQLGGGFHRAAADAGWREPLWEMRLGDQARIARAFLDAHRLSGRPLHREVAERALAWAISELALGGARWAAGRHAAGAGGPGAHATWTIDACAAVVGEAGAAILARRFDLADEPRALAVRGELAPAEARRLPELVARLAAARNERPLPPLDEREDPAAHGWLLGALAALPEPEPALAQARDDLRARLAAADPAGRPAACAAVACGLAEAGDTAAAARWLAAAQAQARDGLLPCDHDALVAPMPCDAEDTADGPGAAGAIALALAALGRHDELAALAAAHAGLLAKAPAVAPSLALAYSASASR
jgi:uncharacterized protein YyaL (SSP411 family)